MPFDPRPRRRFLRYAGASAAALSWPAHLTTALLAQSASARMHTRPIPSSGEALPVVGLGTYINFDVAPGSAEYQRLPDVLRTLFAAGGTVIDSSPMYRRAEQTTGELLSAMTPRPPAFLATKVWTSGRDAGLAQMEESFRLLRTARIDLMQIHNLVDWRTHLPTLRRWKTEGRLRYLGITHYTSSAYGDVEAVLKGEALDCLQINYALDDRAVEQRLLPLARDRGVAVIVNMPFGGGGLLRRLRDRPLPGWAADAGAVSWAQLALRFVLAHPAVTCVIPGTGNPRYMAENAAAGAARPLTEAERKDLIAAAG
jgi:diketogulonate reductase-like aldo/keto reductase